MRRCYRCNIQLSIETRSEEHIILNSLGGFLKSKYLLCNNCNNLYGDSFDREFGEQCNFIANMLNINRDRGRVQNINGIYVDSGDHIYVAPGHKLSLSTPKLQIEEEDLGSEINLTISFQANKKHYEGILKSLSKKYPNINLENLMSTVKLEKTSKPFATILKLPGLEALKSITKSAINFYLHKKGEKQYIEKLIPYLDDKIENQFVNLYYPELNIYNPAAGEVSNLLHLVADSEQKLLYCYIEIFNIYNFIILLNDNYTGASFKHTYIYDVISNVEIYRNVELNINYQQIIDVLQEKTVNFNPIKKRFETVISIGLLIERTELINKIIYETYSEYCLKYSNLDDKIKELLETIETKIHKISPSSISTGYPFQEDIPKGVKEKNEWLFKNYDKYK